MNFKFEEDFDKNLLKLTVSVEAKRNDQRKEIHGWGTIQKLISEYNCASTHILGECLNPVQAVDNETPSSLTATWYFHLTPKKTAPKTVTAVSASTKTTKKTTSRKKRKSSEV